MLDQLLLHLGEGHHVDDHLVVVVLGDDLRQAEHLISGHLAGVGEGLKVDGLHGHAALGHHVARHGGIDTARKQEKAAAIGANGHTARALHGAGMDVGGEIPHLHPHGHVGVMNVHPHMGAGRQYRAARLAGDLDGVQGEILIRALGLYLEGLLPCQVRGDVGLDGLQDALHILLADGGAADGHDAEDLARGGHHAVHVAKVTLRLDIDGALGAVDLEIAKGLGLAAELAEEHILEVALIRALEDDLAVFQKQDLLHISLPPCPRLPRRHPPPRSRCPRHPRR